MLQTVESPAPPDGDEGNYGLSYYQAGHQKSIPSCEVSVAYYRILLDSGSTINTFKDQELVKNMHTAAESLVVLTNGGNTRYTKKGTFGAMTNVWYHPNELEIIISLALLQEVV